MTKATARPRIAIHKFASCDGCQLALLNSGERLLELSKFVEIVHFAEAGPVAPDAQVDIALVEGSITTAHDLQRIQHIRNNSRVLITLGACATGGGLQALRNYADTMQWTSAIYALPQYIDTLASSTPISAHVTVDFEVWGCPVSADQVYRLLHDFLHGLAPHRREEKVCLECKRQGNTCTLVTQQKTCMGPVTRGGCGAICPRMGRDCYACYGPAENCNTTALANRFAGLGLLADDIALRFRSYYSQTTPFSDTPSDPVKPQ